MGFGCNEQRVSGGCAAVTWRLDIGSTSGCDQRAWL